MTIINKNLPKFITFNNGLYTFTPTNPLRDLGPHVIRGALTDSNMYSDFVFSLFVFNEPPFFSSPLRDQRVFLYNEFLYFLPMIDDTEGLPVKFSVSLADNISPMPSFIKITRENVTAYSVNQKHIGTYLFTIKLDDLYSPPKMYRLKITVEDPVKVFNTSGNGTLGGNQTGS